MAIGIMLASKAISSVVSAIDREMFILIGDSKKPMQATICELHANNSYDLPQYPLDNGQFISDTYFVKPQIVSARIFVEGSKIFYVKNELKNTQESEVFFTINSTFERIYSNLKLLEYTEDTTSQVNSGAFFNLTFQEVITIEAMVAGYNAKVQSSPSFAGSNNEGVKKTQKVSALKQATKLYG